MTSVGQSLEVRLLAVEQTLEATRASLSAQLEAERAARARHSMAMSRLLDEMCEVLQRELASEKSRRRDALAQVRASISTLEQKSQPATVVNL